MRNRFFLILILVGFWGCYAQLTPPAELQSYYNGVDFSSTDTALFNDLATITISKHTNILSYSERHNYLYDADEDLNNSSNVYLMYSSESRDKREYLSGNNSYSPQTFNTEHVYPQSLIGNTAKGDLHHLRACDTNTNGSRGNKPFSDGSGSYKNAGSSWFPGDEWKGDVARMIMYLNLRYNESFSDIGSLNLFLKWNKEDPVSNFELQRNEKIFEVQGNRNPFIDNPYLATLIWGGDNAENRWSTLSVSDKNSLAKISIYPNPSINHAFTIAIPSQVNLTALTVYSVIGAKVYEANSTILNNNKIKIDNLKSGIYLLKISSINKSISKKIIIK